MSNRRQALKEIILGGVATTVFTPFKIFASSSSGTGASINTTLSSNDREYWSKLLYKMVNPIFSSLAIDSLKKNMNVEKSPTFSKPSVSVTYLEAVGRSLAGISPWLNLPDDLTPEGRLRKQLQEDILQGLTNAVNPSSADYLNFSTKPDAQPIVDAAFLVQGFMRAPKALWEPLDNKTKKM